MEPIRRILVALDFDPASMRALGYAVRLSRTLGAELIVLHALDVIALSYTAEYPPPIARDELLQAIGRSVDATMARLRENGVEARAFIREGSPAEVIVDTARELEADLVVLGTHGRRGVSRLVLGSVAEIVVRRSPIPVVTIHEWRFEDRIEAAKKLSLRVAPFRGEYDALVALTRGAVPIAIELARTLDAPVQTFLVEPVMAGDAAIGAAAEDGARLLADDAILAQRLDSASTARAVDHTVTLLRERARWLRGPEALPGVPASILMITDRLVAPEAARLAARELRALGAKRVALAVPVCASEVLAHLPPDVERTHCVETTQLEPPDARVYREESEPGNVVATEMLVEATKSGVIANAE